MWKFQAYLHKSILPLFVTAGFIIVFTAGSCSNGRCVTSSYAIGHVGRNMVDGYALVGHVFENVSVAREIECYQTCQTNCRCISFNFLTTVNKDNCQLNSENRHLKPGALVRMEGSHYYDLVIKYNVKGQSPCTQCINRCCSNPQPCLNGGTCRINCEENNKRFFCDCPARFFGQLCENEITNCDHCGIGVVAKIPDDNITASSQFGDGNRASYGRLNGDRGDGWCAKTSNSNNDWLQIDLGDIYKVCAVATQGDRNGDEWVTAFKLLFSLDGTIWNLYQGETNTAVVFKRQGDSNTIDEHTLAVPTAARYVRFNPVDRNKHNCLRVEVYGRTVESI